MRKFVLATIVLSLSVPFSSVSAHPGNTAADGKHYCRTNCDYWGVPWYQRHGHGGSSKSSYSTTSSKTKSYSSSSSASDAKPTKVYKAITALRSTPVYSRPKAEPQYLLRTIAYGTPITNSGSISGWNTVKQADGTTVYISKNHTTLYSPYEGWDNLLEVKAEKGYVFPIPSSDSKAVGSLPKGTVVTVTGSYGDWHFIEAIFNGESIKGYMKNTIVGSIY